MPRKFRYKSYMDDRNPRKFGTPAKRVDKVPRGGFIGKIPNAAKPHYANAAGHAFRGNWKGAVESGVKGGFAHIASENPNLKKVHELYNAGRNRDKALKSRGHVAEEISAPPTDNAVSKHSSLLIPKGLTRVRLGTALMTEHRDSIHTGRPTSSAIWDAVKENGVHRAVMYDSKISLTGEKNFFTRADLDHASGFNTRKFIVPGASLYPNKQDIIDAGNLSSADTISEHQDQRVYLSLLEAMSEMKFHNQSAFMKMTLKVHLVRQKQEPALSPANDISANVLSAVAAGPQNDNAIPLNYQLTDPELSLGTASTFAAGAMLDVDLSLKGRGLATSPYFRDKYDIVKTVSKTLKAGDIWHFKHIHHFGPGLMMDHIYRAIETGASDGTKYSPLSYFYIFELKGQQVEGVYKPSASSDLDTYIGTGPSYMTFEARKTLKYATKSRDSVEATPGGFNEQPAMHIRIYQTDPLFEGNNKEFFVESGKINPDTGTLVVGEMFIPVMSDSARVTQLTKSRHGDDTP